MCGIAGFLAPDGLAPEPAHGIVRAMAGTLAHRGPDGEGVWVDGPAGIALGHRRLAVLDLSPLGRQPMHSAAGRYVLTYNGEVYNVRALRAELEAGGSRFAGRSDTEVLLEAVEAWGLRGALDRCNGMFALALWDRRDRVLHLARDRAGEKPLYYGWLGGTFVFASELKALAAHPGFTGEVDRQALAAFVRSGTVPAPFSIYRGIRKLPPAHLLAVAPGDAEGVPVPWWSLRAVAEAGARDRFPGTPRDAVQALDSVLRDAVRLRMEADVPLGAFLSGGVDSSAVVGLMQSLSPRPVRTFTIAFREAEYDEARHAQAVAAHLGTEHTALCVTPRDALEVIPRLPALWDEPFADASQIPTCLLSALARRHVTVALSGDGGDELFAGYPRHLHARAWQRLAAIPRPLRRLLAGGIDALAPGEGDVFSRGAGRPVPAALRRRGPGTRLRQLAQALGAPSAEALYAGRMAHWRGELPVHGASVPAPPVPAELDDAVDRTAFLDAAAYLPDDILAKVDRASMAVGLETRMPLLDPRVIELAWRLPPGAKVRGWEGKWALRQVLHRYVPRALVERPKMGFCIPLGAWLRAELRPWAEALLDERRLRDEGYLDPGPIRAAWAQHRSGARDRSQDLWNVLMFQAWLDARPAAPPRDRASTVELAFVA